MLEPVLPIVRQVLIMSVNPGFGGQTFIPASLERIRRVREMLDAVNPTCRLEVDGGIKIGNAGKVVAAGADTLVAGSAIYAPEIDIASAMRTLRAEVEREPETSKERSAS
jgi:ribulose-phosphate 3-epimerase